METEAVDYVCKHIGGSLVITVRLVGNIKGLVELPGLVMSMPSC